MESQKVSTSLRRGYIKEKEEKSINYTKNVSSLKRIKPVYRHQFASMNIIQI